MNMMPLVASQTEANKLFIKADYIHQLDQSIKWEWSSPHNINQLKTTQLMSKAEAIALFHKIIKIDQTNHTAYYVVESHVSPGQWRVIVNLDAILEV